MSVSVELNVEECLELLESDVVGRVGMCTRVGPRIVPVNYAMFEDTIVFRTAPYSEVGTLGLGTEVAFEVDRLDYDKRRGWSVLAVGRAEVVDDPEVRQAIQRQWDPDPWAEGLRHLYVRIRWTDLTGRSLGPGT